MATYFSQLIQRLNARRGRRVFIVPTRFGFVYAGFLLLILVGAINYSNSLGHILCFLLASMGWVAMHHSYRNLAKIELKSAYADPVFSGQAITFKLLFENPTTHASYQIELTSKQNTVTSWNPFKRLSGFVHKHIIANLKANQSRTIDYRIASTKRGYQPLGQVRLASQFPLGLFSTWTYFKNDAKVLVYPTAEGNFPLPTSSDSGLQSTSQTHKGNDDFSGLNNYRVGDSLRAIAWKALARDDVLRIKQFTGYQGGELMLTWDAVKQLKDPEARLSQLSNWVLQAETLGINYSLTLPSTYINFGSGDRHRHQCLSALALYDHD